MEPISSGDSEFGRDEELLVDNHLRWPPPRKSIYQRALETQQEKENSNPIVWPSGAKTMALNKNSGTILFGDSALKYN